jgi:hypothetical protein
VFETVAVLKFEGNRRGKNFNYISHTAITGTAKLN